MRIFSLAVMLAIPASGVFAQLAPPNEMGVTMGHIHFIVSDPDATKKAWIDVFGAQEEKVGIDVLKIPGIYIAVRKATKPPSGGTMGSTVHHIGLVVKDYASIKAKAAAANLPWRELTPNVQAFVTFPEGVTVEVMEDKQLATPVAFHHIHESVTDPDAAQAWYMKEFGAEKGSRRNLPAAMMPGHMEIDFLKARMPAEGTKGRSLDHIGFEVKDLEATMKRLQADGVKIDIPMRDMRKQIGLKIAFVSDPNGTSIELTQGLAQ